MVCFAHANIIRDKEIGLAFIFCHYTCISDNFYPFCSFESGEWCGYEELSDQGYFWTRLSGGRSSISKPIKDRTFGNKTGESLPGYINGKQRSSY